MKYSLFDLKVNIHVYLPLNAVLTAVCVCVIFL